MRGSFGTASLPGPQSVHSGGGGTPIHNGERGLRRQSSADILHFDWLDRIFMAGPQWELRAGLHGTAAQSVGPFWQNLDSAGGASVLWGGSHSVSRGNIASSSDAVNTPPGRSCHSGGSRSPCCYSQPRFLHRVRIPHQKNRKIQTKVPTNFGNAAPHPACNSIMVFVPLEKAASAFSCAEEDGARVLMPFVAWRENSAHRSVLRK